MSRTENTVSRRDFLMSMPTLAGACAYVLSHSQDGLAAVGAQATPQQGNSGARSIVDRIKGPLVPIMPAYTADGKLDLRSTCDWIDWLIKRNIKLFWMTPGTTRFKNLSDDEIRELTKAVAHVTKGRAILIAATAFHWTTKDCISFLEEAKRWGADIVKITCDWGRKPDVNAEFEKNKTIAQASPLPLFTYALPGFSHDFLRRILDLPQFVGMKHDSGNYWRHTILLRIVRLHGAKFTCMTGGSLKPYVLVHHFGAQAFADIRICGIAPQLVIDFNRYIDERKYEKAVRIVQDYEEPMREAFSALSFRHPYRTCLHLAGHFKSDFEREPDQRLRPDEVKIIRKVLTELKLL